MTNRSSPGAGSIRQRGPNSFELRFTTADGKRHSKTVRAYDDENGTALENAQAILNGALEELADNGQAAVGQLTLRAYAQTWLKRCESELPQSVELYRRRWNARLSTAPFVDWPLRALASDRGRLAIRKWYAALAGSPGLGKHKHRKVSPRYAHVLLRTLSTILSSAVEDLEMPFNPASSADTSRRKGSRAKKAHLTKRVWDVLTLAEMEALWESEAISDEERAAICAGFGVGWRPGEQFSIRLTDVHAYAAMPSVHIRYGSPFGPPKDGDERTMWLHGIGLKAVRLQLEILKEKGALSGPKNPHGLLFPDLDLFTGRRAPPVAVRKNGKPGWPKGFVPVLNLSQWLKLRLATVSITRRMTWYWAARHTYATACISGLPTHVEAPWPIAFVGEQLGHSTTYMTETYGHLLPSVIAEAAGRANVAHEAKGQRRGNAPKAYETSGFSEARETTSYHTPDAKALRFLVDAAELVGESPSLPTEIGRQLALNAAEGIDATPEECDRLASLVLTSGPLNRLALAVLNAPPAHKVRAALRLVEALLTANSTSHVEARR